MTPPIHASIDDSAPLLARTAHRKACADAVSRHRAGWAAADPVRRILSLSNKGLLHCVHAFVLSKESAPPPTAHHAIVSRRPVANPPNRLHATGADRRTSLTSLYVSPSCGVPRDGVPLCEGIKKGREGIKTPSRIELARPFQFANRNRQQRQRSAKETTAPTSNRLIESGAAA